MCSVIQSRNNYGNKYKLIAYFAGYYTISNHQQQKITYICHDAGQNLIHLDFIHRFITGDIWFETCTSEFQKFHFSSNNKVHVEDN